MAGASPLADVMQQHAQHEEVRSLHVVHHPGDPLLVGLTRGEGFQVLQRQE